MSHDTYSFSKKLVVHVVKDSHQWCEKHVKLAKRVLKRVFNYEKTCLSQSGIFVSVCLADHNLIRQLNFLYRHKSSSTNVLSFRCSESSGAFPNLCQHFLGEIFLCYSLILSESTAQNKNFDCYYTQMLVHGMLHLLGYDHSEGPYEQTDMFFKEQKLLTILK